MKRLFPLVLALIFASSCNMSDDYHELGSGFNYNGEGGESHSIDGGDIAHNTVIYGNVVSYNSNKKFIIAAQKPSWQEYRNEFGSNLWVNYYRYHDFIADSSEWKQNWPVKEVVKIRKFGPLYPVLKCKKVTLKNSITDGEKCKTVADSLMKIQPYYQNIFRRKRNYWIIDKDKNAGFGPVDSLQFVQQCKRLGVTLKLEPHY